MLSIIVSSIVDYCQLSSVVVGCQSLVVVVVVVVIVMVIHRWA